MPHAGGILTRYIAQDFEFLSLQSLVTSYADISLKHNSGRPIVWGGSKATLYVMHFIDAL